jgi:hypothetical protein
MDAARRGGEAADVMDESAGVHERVLVRAAHLDPVILVGDTQSTRRT